MRIVLYFQCISLTTITFPIKNHEHAFRKKSRYRPLTNKIICHTNINDERVQKIPGKPMQHIVKVFKQSIQQTTSLLSTTSTLKLICKFDFHLLKKNHLQISG